MSFAVTRTGDLGFAAILNYHTVDGTAIAGTDYTATTGQLVVPAGAASATIPITLAANTGTAADSAFQVQLDSTLGVGPVSGFAAQQTFATGTSPYAVEYADINGDGKPDLIVANFNDNTVSVLLNTTAPGAVTPTFALQQTFATGANPDSIEVADVNGDGKPDLIVANNGSNTVSVLLNTTPPGAAMPSFATQQTFPTGSNPRSVAVADVNGDGKSDLIVSNLGDNTVSVLLNTTPPGAATPSFAAQQTFSTGSGLFFVAVADVNGDGRPDLIVPNSSAKTVSVLLNTTPPGAVTPTFAAQQAFSTGNGPQSVGIADVNGDGRPDLIVPNNGGNTVSVLLNTTAPGASTPSFAAQQTFLTGSGPDSVGVVDINGDGKPDLVVANINDNTVSVLLNMTPPGAVTPAFAAQQTYATGTNPASVDVADVNGDGKPDLVVANINANTVSVLLNTTAPGTASPSFAAQQTFSTGSGPQSVAVADVNGDGKPDLIVADNGGSTASVLLNTTPPGAATPSFATQQTFATGNGPFSVAVADLNGDGKPDLIVTNSSDNTVSVLLNTTAPGASTLSFAAQQSFATGTVPVFVAVADVNGDGKPDLIIANLTASTVSVLLNTTAPGAATPGFATQQTFSTGVVPYSVAVADVNGDGKPDLIVANSSSSTVSVLLNTTLPGAATPTFAAQQSFATGNGPDSVGVADVNGDGKPDLIVVNRSSNTVSVLLNTTLPGAATLSFAAQQTFAIGNNPYSIAVSDINGDGKPDLVVANANDNTVSVLLNTTATGAATPSFAAQQTFSSGNGPISVAVADVNGDGKPDLIIANNVGNTISALLNSQLQSLSSGSPATGTIVHDYIFADGFGP
ncbi:MAG: beta strand repeat-containing protein [Rudaea sp.]